MKYAVLFSIACTALCGCGPHVSPVAVTSAESAPQPEAVTQAPIVVVPPGQSSATSAPAQAQASPAITQQVNAAIDAREAREKQQEDDQKWVADRARFVEVLRQQQERESLGYKPLLPYRIDAAGNISHVEADGSQRRVSDDDLRHPSAQSMQEAQRGLDAARAGAAARQGQAEPEGQQAEPAAGQEGFPALPR